MPRASNESKIEQRVDSASDLLKGGIAPLLQQVAVKHGPVPVVGRLLLKAEQASRGQGVTLTLEPVEAFASFMRAKMPHAPPLAHFRPAPGAFAHDRSLCLLGRDRTGEIVATQVVRAYDWSGSCLRDEAESLRMFYGTTQPQPGVSCSVTAPCADRIGGTVAYSGGGWYAPAYRGKGLSRLLPRISRMLALTLWNTEFTVSFVEWALVEKGVVARYGYRNIENGIEIMNMIEAPFIAAVVWMDREFLLQDADEFLAQSGATSVAGDEQGGADQIRRAV